MTTTYLTANDLKNLNHLGNPGEFSQEAYDFINDFGDVDTEATEFCMGAHGKAAETRKAKSPFAGSAGSKSTRMTNAHARSPRR